MLPPVAEYVTETATLSPVFLHPYAMNCCNAPTMSVAALGLMTTRITRRFLTLEVPLTLEVVSVAVMTASVADVSAV